MLRVNFKLDGQHVRTAGSSYIAQGECWECLGRHWLVYTTGFILICDFEGHHDHARPCTAQRPPTGMADAIMAVW